MLIFLGDTDMNKLIITESSNQDTANIDLLDAENIAKTILKNLGD